MAQFQCLELLRGPTDERRFVGLLLVTKTLQAQSEADMLAVYDAVGANFLSRLLLPLHKSQAPFQDPATAEKATGTCAVGLAVLSSICRVPQLARSADMIEKVPLFVKVVKSGGISRIVGQQPSAGTNVPAGGGTDDAAVVDALECLACIASASEEGRQVALQSQAMDACALLLQSSSSSKQLAVRLFVALLDRPKRAQVFPEQAGALATAVPALAQLLDSEHASGLLSGTDPLALQLEALHALLLILPVPIPEGLDVARLLEQHLEGGTAPWLQAVKRGLQTLFRSRVGPLQRQAALHLTAALLDVAGPAWLLSRDSTAFYQVLVELVKIEIMLLLRDALSPDAVVPLQSEAMPSASQQRRPERPEEAGKVAEEDAGPSSSRLDAGDPGLASSAPPEAVPSQPSAEESAGARAARGLPVLFALFEGCVEALAAATEEAEQAGHKRASAALPPGVAERAMSTLGETAEAVLQFLEELHSRQVDDLLALAASRALSRFLAEAPHLEQQRVQSLLPWLLSLQNGQALPYLLPLLLQATAEDGSKRAAWLAAARSPQALGQFAMHLKALTQQSAIAAALTQQSAIAAASQPGKALLDEASTSLYMCCAVLANIADFREPPPPSSRQLLAEYSVQIAQSLAAWAHQVRQTHPGAKPGDFHSAEEPRLVVYAGLLCAMGLQAAAELGQQHPSPLTPSAALEVSGVVLWALEVGDLILGLNEEHRSLQQASDIDLGQLASLHLGVTTGTALEAMPDSDEDLAEEVRVQWSHILKIATALLQRRHPALTSLLRKPPDWVNALESTNGSQPAELQAFVNLIKILKD